MYQLSNNSFKLSSMNLVSTGFRPGPPTPCTHIDGITLTSALGIYCTSIWFSSGGKYWSVWDGINMALAVIDERALVKSP